jgi:hypothetical protein
MAPAAGAAGSDDIDDNDDDNNTTFVVTQEIHLDERQRQLPRCWRPRRRRRSTEVDEDHEKHEPHPQPQLQTEPERHADGDPDSDINGHSVFKITEQVVEDQDNIEPPCAWKNMHTIPMSHSHCPPQQQQDDSLQLDLLHSKADLCHKNRAVIPEEEHAQHENHDEQQDNSSSDVSPTDGSDDAIHNESGDDCADDIYEPATITSTIRLPQPHAPPHAQRVPMLWRRRRTSIQ